MKRNISLRGVLYVLALLSCLAGCSRGKEEVVYETQNTETRDVSALSPEAAASSSGGGTAETGSAAVSGTVVVHVCGEVRNPGIYELPEGSRIFHALQAAGGLTEKADDRILNQAELLSDGEQIVVWSLEEMAARNPEETPGSPRVQDNRVNLNTASREELMTLPGIGEMRAEAILVWRETHGGFSSPEELLQIDGIGEKSFNRLREQITI